MGLIRARRVTLQICILYKPENSVILFSAKLGLERRWVRRKTKDYSLHRALRREIFLQKSKDLERQLQLQNARSLTKAWYQTPAAKKMGVGFESL